MRSRWWFILLLSISLVLALSVHAAGAIPVETSPSMEDASRAQGPYTSALRTAFTRLASENSSTASDLANSPAGEADGAISVLHRWLEEAGLDPARLGVTGVRPQASALDLVGSNFPIADYADAVSSRERLTNPSLAYNPERSEYLAVWHAFDPITEMSIYGRLLSADGTPLGSEFPICEAAGHQIVPDVAYDAGADQYWVVWTDLTQQDSYDVYAQRVSPTGTLLGSPIMANSGAPMAVGARVSADDYHCAIVWISIPDASHSQILVRGFNTDGSPYTQPLLLSGSAADVNNPDICSNAEDGAFVVVWQEQHSGTGYDIMAFQVTWDLVSAGPLTVSTAANHQQAPRVAYSEAADRFLVVWQDARSGQTWDIYGQLIARNGTLAGGALPIYTGNFHDTRPAVSGQAGASQFLVAFELDPIGGGTGTLQIYGRTVAGSGSLGTTFAIRHWHNSRSMPSLARWESGNEYLVVWADAGLGSQDDIMAQRVRSDSGLEGGLLLISAGRKGQEEPSVSYSAARNEYLVVWADYRTTPDYDIYRQRLSADGQRLGPPGPLGTGGSIAHEPDIAYNSTADQYLVVWAVVASDVSGYEIYARLLAGDGNPLSPEFLVSRDTGTPHEGAAQVAFNASDSEYLVVWHAFTGGRWRIWAQRLSATAQMLGSNFTVSSSPQNVNIPRLAHNRAHNEYLIIWGDERNGRLDIYGQRLAGSGAAVGGNFPVSTASGDKGRFDIAYNDLHDEYLVAWGDTRSGDDVYAQRLSASGAFVGGEFPVASTGVDEFSPSIGYDLLNNAYLVIWGEYDEMTDYDVHGTTVSATGAVTAPSFALTSAPETQLRSTLAYNSVGGEFLIVWHDFRNGSYDVYGQFWRSGPPPTPFPTATLTTTPTRTPTATPTTTATLIATPTATRTPTRTASPTVPTNRICLPIILRSYAFPVGPTVTPSATLPGAGGISGRVTYNGAPAASIVLTLQRWDGANISPADAAVTDSQGRYRFTSAPALSTGHVYYVQFGPNSDSKYVYRWFGPDIETYSPGMAVAGGDFDIADVQLLAPAPDARVALPAAFAWQRRGIAGDSYKVHMFDPGAEDEWWTEDLGDVGSFTLTALAEEMAYDHEYGWDVWVCATPDSCGDSFYYRSVTFLESAGLGAQAPEGAGLKLRVEELPWKARGRPRP